MTSATQKDLQMQALRQHIQQEMTAFCGSERFVWGHGPLDAVIALVGEGPGRHESEQGLPFVGPSGRLLRDELKEAGIPTGEVYITNVVKCRITSPAPRGGARNRPPNLHELRKWRPFLLEELAIVQPAVVVCLGAAAAEAVMDIRSELAHRRRIRDHGPAGRWMIATFHPSYVMRFGRDRDSAVRKTLRQDLMEAAEQSVNERERRSREAGR